ncbi:hypothetical protein WJX77_005835 [Trebouxia sp. C0004]
MPQQSVALYDRKRQPRDSNASSFTCSSAFLSIDAHLFAFRSLAVTVTPASVMNKMSMAAIAVLLVSVMFIGAQSRKTLGTVDVATIEAMEHQRILAELEEVHQLRERMLQQAATYTSSGHGGPAPAPAPPATPEGTATPGLPEQEASP